MTETTAASALGVCAMPAAPPNRPRTTEHNNYVYEILDHAGLCYRPFEPASLQAELPRLKVLLTIGEGALDDAAAAALRAWLESGGCWIAVAGVLGQHDLCGLKPVQPVYQGFGTGIGTLGEGYLDAGVAGHPVLSGIEIPPHFFNGAPMTDDGAEVLAGLLDAHQRKTERVGIADRAVGEGRVLFIAPDITGSVVRIQQGVSITQDGVPSSDGVCACCDGVLKTDDGLVLDYDFDRQEVSGVPGLKGFFEPVADVWKDLLLRSIFYGASRCGASLPLLWYYPRNLPALAVMSHDTDGNKPENARELLATLAEADIKTTWCTILPGYDADLTNEIRDAGHELAMHYDALPDSSMWSRDLFSEQHRKLTELFSGDHIVSNKNHYLRWEGDLEFYHWCAEKGIEMDQSKGPSKLGVAGYAFGTSHPYFPIDRNGAPIDVLELTTQTQDLNVFGPDALCDAMIPGAADHYGVLHLLYHPAHTSKPEVRKALLESVEKARAAGMEWWTGVRLNAWERARRKARWIASDGGTEARLALDAPLEDATVLWLSPTPGAGFSVDGEDACAEVVERWGFRFAAAQLKGEREGEIDLRLNP